MNPSNTMVSVDPAQIGNFVKSANSQFSLAVEALNDLNRTAAASVFTGANASAFKADVQNQLKTFTNNTKAQLAAITTASNNACKAIGNSLGEEIATMEFNPEQLKEVSTESGGDALKIDYSSLEGVRSSLVNSITTVQTIMKNHRSNFASIPWTGRAKTQATARVDEICTQGIRDCGAMADSLLTKIANQVESTNRADTTIG